MGSEGPVDVRRRRLCSAHPAKSVASRHRQEDQRVWSNILRRCYACTGRTQSVSTRARRLRQGACRQPPPRIGMSSGRAAAPIPYLDGEAIQAVLAGAGGLARQRHVWRHRQCPGHGLAHAGRAQVGHMRGQRHQRVAARRGSGVGRGRGVGRKEGL